VAIANDVNAILASFGLMVMTGFAGFLLQCFSYVFLI
jgi:hypothetical protein